MALVIIITIAVILFVLAFVTKRRFGVLGLGLAAGVVLSQLWAVTLAALLQSQNLPVSPLSYSTVGQLSFILLPPLILMIAGPKHHTAKGALLSSILFALFALLFIIVPITRDFAVTGDSNPVFDTIARWQNVLIALGTILAIIDTAFFHRPKTSKHGKDAH